MNSYSKLSYAIAAILSGGGGSVAHAAAAADTEASSKDAWTMHLYGENITDTRAAT